MPTPPYSPKAHEKVILDAISQKLDPHSAVYCWLNDLPYQPIGGAARAEVKRINIPFMYSEEFLPKLAGKSKPSGAT